MNNRTHAKGFSLIEILVALVVMSLGLLGFAALQIAGLSSNKIALDRSQASILAYEIIDSMRANRDAAVAKSEYNHALGSGAPSGPNTSEQDIAYWLNQLAERLPNADGSIAVTPATGEVSVNIQWDNSKGGGNLSNFSLNSRL